MNKALFLDRDGIINERIIDGYVMSAEQFVLLNDILPILVHAKQNGYLLILISNQQGVGKGVMSEDDLADVTEYMQTVLFERIGLILDDVYYCTDLDTSESQFRKPAPGMLLEAIDKHDLEPAHCWFLGDSPTDAQAGRAAGVHTILVGPFPPTLATLVTPSLSSGYAHIQKLIL